MSLIQSRRLPRAKLMCALVASCFATQPFANPVGPSVVSGQASFNTAGKSLTVTNSPNAIINWQGFSIGAGEITRFQQQSAASAVLNRVVGQDPSAILGTLSSNGRVYLVNPNGILFGQGSRVDVAGLVATTLNLSNNDFLAGRLNFEASTTAGSLINQGDIVTGSGGRVLLIAPDVQNHGLISSPQGEVVLAAGKSVQLVEADLPMLKVEVQAGGEARNFGSILAEGGKIGVYAGLINQRGVVRADSATADATGKVVFRASDTTLLEAGSVTSAAGARGGEIQVLGNKVGLTGNAQVNASGEAGGGTVLVGGDFQGRNAEVPNAFRTYFGPDATIKADAIASGDGGKVIVWSDDATRAYGAISARGGAQSGDGGFVEVSGKRWLDFGANVDTRAPQGRTGSLLLDPSNIFVAASQASATAAGMVGTDTSAETAAGSFLAEASGAVQDSLLLSGTLSSLLLTNDVTVSTANASGTGVGNITVVDAVSYAPVGAVGGGLRLLAHNDITVNALITNGGISGATVMYAGWDGNLATPGVVSGIGVISLNQSVSAYEGITLAAGKDINVGSATASSVTASTIFGDLVLSAAGGNINVVNSAAVESNGGSVSLTAPLGTIAVSNGLIYSGNSGGSVNLSAQLINVDDSKGPSKGIQMDSSEGAGTITITGSSNVDIRNSDVLVSGQGASVTIESQTGALNILGASVANPGGTSTVVADSGNGPAQVSLIASNTATVTGSSITANGGSNGGNATVSITVSAADNGIAVTNSVISALAGNGAAGFGSSSFAATPGGAGGNASISFATGPAGAFNIANADFSGATITATAGSGGAGGDTGVGDGGAGGVGGTAAVTINAANGISVSGTSAFTMTAGNGGPGGQFLFSGGTGGPGGNGGTATFSLNGGSLNLSSSTIDTVGGTGALGGTGAITGASGAGGSADVSLLISVGGALNLNGASVTAAGGLAPGGLSVGGNATISLTGGQIGLSGSSAVSAAGGDGRATGGSASVKLTSDSSISVNASSLAAAGGNANSSASAPGPAELVLDAGTSIALGDSAGPVTLNATAGTSFTVGVSGIIPYSGDAIIAAAAGSGNIDTGATITADGEANTALVGAGSVTASIALLAPNGYIRATAPGAGLLQVQNGGITGLVKLDAMNGIGEVGSPIRIADDFATIIASNSGTNDVVLSLATGSWYLDGFYMSVSNAASAPGGLIDLTAEAGDVYVASGYTLTSANGSVALTAAGAAAGSGLIDIASGTTVSAPNGNITLTADNQTIGGTVSAATGAVALRTYDVNRAVNIEASPSLDVLSFSPTTLQNVTASTLEIGHIDSAAPTRLTTALTNTDVNAGTLRLYGGDIELATGGADIGSSGTPFDRHLELKANNNVQLTVGNVYLADNRNLTVIANNDASTFGSVNIGGVTVKVGSTAANAGSMTMQGVDINAILSGEGTGTVQVTGTGSQNLTAQADFTVQNTNASTGALLIQADAGTQNIFAGGTLSIAAGSGTNTTASVATVSGPQNVTASSIQVSGGASGSGNTATLWSGGNQNIDAVGITLNGGASGGGTNIGNYAEIHANASQDITVGFVGLNLFGGGGAGSDTANSAGIYQTGTAGTSQTITVDGGATILMIGGSSAGTAIGTGNGSKAFIVANGDTQTINFSAGGTIDATGGTVGNQNYALIWAQNGTQTITGSPSIALTGGASGGAAGGGNYAQISSNLGTQTITAASLSLSGSTGGTENFAQVGQFGASANQFINVTGGGTVTLDGGSGTSNFARIRNGGLAQTIDFVSGGGLALSGGDGASGNYAQIVALAGTQTITGSPTIDVTGGAAGGIDTAGNYASIRAGAGLQTIASGNLTLQAGLGGTNNFAVVEAPTQDITVNGDLSQTGGNSVAGTIGAGARIGGLGGASPTATNLTLDVSGNVNLTGGTLTSAGAAIGSAGIIASPQDTNITMTVGGSLTLTGGSGSGSRIGSSTTSLGGGDISVTTVGDITLGDATPGFGTGVITTGNVLLKTTGPGSNIVLGGSVYTVDPLDLSTSTITLDAANAIVGGAGVISGSSNQTLWLKAVSGIGTPASPVRINNGDTGPDLNAVNAGTTAGDIAVAFVSGDVVPDDLENFKNSNASGTYYAKSESGNILLDIPFKPWVSDDLAPQPLAAGQSVVFDAPVGSIAIGSGGSIEALGSGNVTLFAGNTAPAGLDNGVHLNGGRVTAEAGAITLTGTGKAGNAVSSFTGGVTLDNGAVVHTTSGAINLTGQGGSFVSGIDAGSIGVWVLGTGTEISTVDGAIALSGTGGSVSNAPSIGRTRGVLIEGSALLQATGLGTISIAGAGGTLVDRGINGGVLITDATVTTLDGAISITGGGGTATGTLYEGSRGVSIGDALIESTGAGSIVITGMGGTSESGGGNFGALIQGGPGQNVVRTVNGSITINGTGGSTTVSGGDNDGIRMNDNVLIQSTGSGAVSITGQAGTSGDAAANAAILLQGNGITLQTNSGTLQLAATGDLYLGDPAEIGQSVSVTTTTGAQNISATGDIALSSGTIYVYSGGAGSTQTVSAGGALTLTGGNGTNEYALLASAGAQNITAASIELTGGNAGSGNSARIYAGGNQTVSAGTITLLGGLGGGVAGNGNFALIQGGASQTINVGSGGLLLEGGSGTLATETDNFANIYQGGAGGTQVINVASGGAITVYGGDAAATNVDVANNHGSWAFIRADGTSQAINFAAPGGAIYVIGGDNGSGNYAGINARFGSQTISGAPDINVFGGATGGVAGEGNWAQIYANAGQQNITANTVYLDGGEGIENFARLWSGTQQNITAATMALIGGAAGTANYAVINAPLQSISVSGDLMMLGGASAATPSAGGGARIGGLGGASPSATNLTLDVGGNLSLTGGDMSDSGSAIGSGIGGGQATDIAIDVTGSITLNPGTVANAGSRIGSPASSVAGGTISVIAGSDLVMNGTASGIGTAIRTTGAVSLHANAISQGTFTTIVAGQLDVATTAGASLLGGGNAVSAFGATNAASGAIELLNTSSVLALTGFTQVPGGAINIAQTGDLVLPAMTFTNGTISASGVASIPTGVTFTAAGGTLSATTLDVQSGGTLNGTGSVTANVSNSGTVAPGTSAGILTVSGNYTQQAGGTLAVELGGTTAGTEYDRLAVTGTATLGGTLSVTEGAVAPVPGTTYSVITCGSCTGSFATVSAPTVNVTPTYGATSFALGMGGFLNVWGGGTDWSTASWSRGLPGPNDDVVIDDGSATASTLAVSSGAQSVRSIITSENLTLSGGSLNLAAPSTVNGTLTLSGGTLTGPGTLAVSQLNWTAGTIGAGGAITVGSGGATLTNASAVILDGRSMTVNGPFTMAGTNWLDMYNGAVLTVNGLATLDTSNLGSSFFGINTFGAPATVNYAGGITKTGALPFDQVATANTQGTVQALQGELVFDTPNGGTHAGTSFVAAAGALIKIANGAHLASGNVTFSGAGVTQLGNNDGVRTMSFAPSGGTLTNNGTLNVVPGATLGALTNQGTLNLTSVPLSGLLTNNGTTNAVSASLGAVDNSGTLNLDNSSLSGMLTNTGAVNVGGTVNASGGIDLIGGLITVPLGQTLGVGGSGLVLAGGMLLGNGTISGNVNNQAGTVSPGASPGILTINGDYTQGASGVLAVDVGGTVAGTEYDQLIVNGNVFLDGNLNTTLFGSYVPVPGDSYTFIVASGTISGSFANFTQPASLLPPAAGPAPTSGSQVTVSVVSPSVPPAIEPSFNYTVVATETSGEPVENILIPVLGVEGTAGTEESTLEKKPPACS